jgi:D-glycero-alpha-D-manno-heptose-7-phosphate kinase
VEAVAPAVAVRASAPARLDFAGGWTDVATFADAERGVVVNAAIELRVHVEVSARESGYFLRSEDLDQALELPGREALAPDGRLDLLKAALRLTGIGPCALRTRSEAPPGSGLGTSGALDVSLLAALDAARGIRRSPEALAEEGWRLETVEAGLAGGKQDQYAAALGGCHHFTFEHGHVKPVPLRLDPAFAETLERRIIVCYTGSSRVSSDTIARVMGAYRRGQAAVVGALRTLVEIAERLAEALARGDLAAVAALLTENWQAQQRLDADMCTASMARLEAAMRGAGALGGKAAGAGAGGCMFFVTGGDAVVAATAAREAGARVLPFSWAKTGVRVGAAV